MLGIIGLWQDEVLACQEHRSTGAPARLFGWAVCGCFFHWLRERLFSGGGEIKGVCCQLLVLERLQKVANLRALSGGRSFSWCSCCRQCGSYFVADDEGPKHAARPESLHCHYD